MDSINDVVASATLGAGAATRSAENQSGGTLSQAKLKTIPEEHHETMTFSQSVDAASVDVESTLDSTYNDGGSASEAGLGEFLARPVQLDLGGSFKSLQWAVSAGTIGTSLMVIDPWTLWQANVKVKQKLSNFAYLKGTLRVRLVVAGTPFHYGRIQVTYVPFASSNTILGQYITHTPLVEGPMMYLSTGMRTEIDPMSSTPVEMLLPFTHFKNWMDVSVPETLGSLYLRELVPLTRASDTAVSSIAITAFVWMENAELCVPTLAAPTSKREQPIPNSVSGIASAVAAGAGKLSSVPVIGNLAKATSIASGAAADVAKLFGLSRPVDVTTPAQMKPISSSSMSFTQGDSFAQKLTLDPQQEITIDPRTVGLSNNDEMTFESIVNREVWLTTVPWTDTGGPFTVSGASVAANIGQLLFVANVTPNLCKRVSIAVVAAAGGYTAGNYQVVQPTPSMFVARAFNFWRGTMAFRFRVVASSFHRGNLRITYDPISATQATDTNSQMTHVMDISTSREVVIRIPWCSATPYLEVANQLHEPLENYSPALHNATINYAYTNYSKSYHNGVIMATIVNQLVAPNAQPAYVSVSSWMEDGEFQCPSRRIEADHPLLYKATSGVDSQVDLVKGKQSSDMSQICFGERITSVRAMMKRSSLCALPFPANNGVPAVAPVLISVILPSFPLFSGAGQSVGGCFYLVSFITYFAGAYAFRRGGVRYNVIWDDLAVVGSVANTTNRPVYVGYRRSWDSVSPGTTGAINKYYTLDAIESISQTLVRDSFKGRIPNGYEGAYMNNWSTQERIHEVEIPYYGGTRFSLAQYCPVATQNGANAWQFSLSKNPAELGFQVWVANLTGTGCTAFCPSIFASSAEDLTYFWFQAPPPLYILVGT